MTPTRDKKGRFVKGHPHGKSFLKGQKAWNKKADDETIKKLYGAGRSSVKIAEEMGVNKTTILRSLKRQGVSRKKENGVKTQFKKGNVPKNKKDKIKLICKICSNPYYLKPSAAFRISNKGQYRTKYCSVKCRQDSFRFNEEFKEKARKNMIKYLKSKKNGPTRPEIMFKNLLLTLGLKEGLDFIEQYHIDRYVCDFAFPDKRIIFEVQGDYYHVNPSYKKQAYNPETLITFEGKRLPIMQIAQLKKDKIRFDFLKKSGWKVYPVWESNLYKNRANVTETVKSILKTK